MSIFKEFPSLSLYKFLISSGEISVIWEKNVIATVAVVNTEKKYPECFFSVYHCSSFWVPFLGSIIKHSQNWISEVALYSSG